MACNCPLRSRKTFAMDFFEDVPKVTQGGKKHFTIQQFVLLADSPKNDFIIP